MSNDVERFQRARIHLAGVYADRAAKPAKAVTNNPAASARGEYQACQIVWGALVDIENALRVSVLAGDPIDDFYREGAAHAGRSKARCAHPVRQAADEGELP